MSGRFSPFVIKALTDLITGGAGRRPDVTEPIGIYRSGPKIEALFLDCGLDMRIGSSSRLPATTQFLRDLAAMGKPETKVSYLCGELGITRQTFYTFADPKGGTSR